MSASLDRPAPFYGSPGPDEQQDTLAEAVDTVLAIVSADRMVTPDEIRHLQRLQAGIQAIAMQKSMPAEQPAPSNETNDFGSTAGTEPTPGSQPMPGAEFAQGGY